MTTALHQDERNKEFEMFEMVAKFAAISPSGTTTTTTTSSSNNNSPTRLTDFSIDAIMGYNGIQPKQEHEHQQQQQQQQQQQFNLAQYQHYLSLNQLHQHLSPNLSPILVHPLNYSLDISKPEQAAPHANEQSQEQQHQQQQQLLLQQHSLSQYQQYLALIQQHHQNLHLLNCSLDISQHELVAPFAHEQDQHQQKHQQHDQQQLIQQQQQQQQQLESGNTTTTSSKKTRPKKYQCPYCWVALSNTGQFKGHIRIHTGERPFVCDHSLCGKSFTRNEELTRHKRIHTGQRPYPCTICNKCFGRKDHLKKHTRTHEKHLNPSGPATTPTMSSSGIGSISPNMSGRTSSGAQSYISDCSAPTPTSG